MAAIDFPAAPVDGQAFAAPNGVVYVWRTSPGIWVAQSGGTTTPGGDFMATLTTVGMNATPATILFNSIYVGNAGNWYNSATGRWTPPAGRFQINTGFSFSTAGSLVLGGITIRKNGVALPNNQGQTSGAANNTGSLTVDAMVDANGTDWFDVQGSTHVAATATGLYFSGFPLSGIKGPPGDAGSPGGDFMATNSAAFVGGVNTYVTMALNTVVTGNSGNWYNPANGQYRPPPGRFLIRGTIGIGYSGAGAVTCEIILRKNGAQIARGGQVPGAASWFADPEVEALVDANGTDVFDIQSAFNSANNTVQAACANFLAFPISGIRGLPGPPGPPPLGSLSLYNEQVLAAPAVQLVVTIPPTFKRLDLQWATRNVSDVNGILYLQAMESGVPFQSGYQTEFFYGQNTSAVANALGNQVGEIGFTQSYCSGTARLMVGPGNSFTGDIGAWAKTSAGAAYTSIQESVWFSDARANLVTGFRLVNQGSTPNFDTGSFLRAYVVV